MRRWLIGALALASATAFAQDRMWLHNADRFSESDEIDLTQYDSIEFRKAAMYLYYKKDLGKKLDHATRTYASKYDYYTFHDPGRILYRPSALKNHNFDSQASEWCFQRSKESEHYIVFWGPKLGDDPKKASGNSLDVDLLLERAENLFDYYSDSLGFVVSGNSKSTDKYKIEIFVADSTGWNATGSGYDTKIGALWCTPVALNSSGGHTLAHEIGHSFQYLVSCDLGESHGWRYGFGSNGSGGCMWWESCAQWQGFKVYPEQQFTNYRFSEYLSHCNKNLLHEDWRYANFFIQDYWCMLHGKKFIGTLWREETYPEDPVEAYQRITGISQSEFNDEIFNYAQRTCTWDIDGIRERGNSYIDCHSTYVSQSDDDPYLWQVDSAHCVENYGYNHIRVNNAEAGDTVRAYFKGLAGEQGYRKYNVAKAGWRYGFVAYLTDGTRVYGQPYKEKEGVAEFVVPEGTEKMWFVVTGAPTSHWRHAWDDSSSNDEQWPYQVKFEGTNKYGCFEDYPSDYVRKDTTVVINAELAYDGSSYSSVVVQYDMEAASKALGLSTKQLQSTKCSSTANPGFIAINSSNATITTNTTTSTSSSTVLGHWFNSLGNVCNYDNSAYIFAEFRPETFKCYVGQYPGHLKKGRTYTIKQGIRYKPSGSTKYYRVTYIVKVKVV